MGDRWPFFMGPYDGDFPVQMGRKRTTMRRDIAALAWEEYAAQGHGAQSLDRIGERGGFGTFEVIHLLADALIRERAKHAPAASREGDE